MIRLVHDRCTGNDFKGHCAYRTLFGNAHDCGTYQAEQTQIPK